LLPISLSIPLPNCREKRENSVQKLFFFYCKIFTRASLFLRYGVTLCPKEETLSLYIVIALYHHRFGHMCTLYRIVPLSLQENGSVSASSSYRFWNIRTVIAIISYFFGNIRIIIAS
jgi:hypothetical protein